MPTVGEATKTYPFLKVFKEWRALKGEAGIIADRQDGLRDDLRDNIRDFGEEDPETGSYYWYFKTPYEYIEPAKPGKKPIHHLYTALKAERRLIPAAPTPDPAKAEELLRKKGLWMTQEQEITLAALRLSCPNVTFNVSLDVDAVTILYIQKKVTEKEYQSILVEQKVQWALVPQEDK